MTSPGWMAHHCVTGLGWPGCLLLLIRALGDTGLRVGCGWSGLLAGMSGFQGTGGGGRGAPGSKEEMQGLRDKISHGFGEALGSLIPDPLLRVPLCS